MKPISVIVLDDSEEVLFLFQQYFAGTQFQLQVGRSVEEALDLMSHQITPFLLLTDFELGSRYATEVLEEIIEQGIPTLGIVVMSGHLNFREYLEPLRIVFCQMKLHYYEISKPFDPIQIEYLFEKIILEVNQNNSNPLPDSDDSDGNSRFTYLYSGNAGAILKAARESLDIGPEAVVEAVAAQGLNLSVSDYLEREAGVTEVSPSEWFKICGILNISTDCYGTGYCVRRHLGLVRKKIQEGSFELPVSESLSKAVKYFQELERQEEEAIFSSGIERSTGVS